ncbi:MAG: VanZ family protein [Zavarzinella sp.]|nr:VanZ family protein [Zavarzinella sp.]
MACCRIFTAVHAVVFAGFLTAWTIALLSPVPHQSAERVLGGPLQVFLFGKGLHISAYAFLAVLGATLPWRGWKWTWVLVGLVAHGAVTEFFQQFVGRGASVRDVGLDAIGVTVGGLLVWAWRSRRSARGRQEPPPGDERPAG